MKRGGVHGAKAAMLLSEQRTAENALGSRRPMNAVLHLSAKRSKLIQISLIPQEMAHYVYKDSAHDPSRDVASCSQRMRSRHSEKNRDK